MSSETVVLITGANRGLGKGLVESYLLLSNHIVVAAVRDPAKSDSQALNSLPVSTGSKLITVKIDSSSDTDAIEAVQSLQSTHAIKKLDIVIANAGICEFHGSALNASIQSLRDHLNVNTVGALTLFQATWPLLKVAPSPKFVTMSSTLGSIGTMKEYPTPSVAYGSSKAALNWLTKSIHDDYAPLIAFPIHPGWIATDMGDDLSKFFGGLEPPNTLEQSIKGTIKVIDEATREKTSGTFAFYEGGGGNPTSW